MLASDERREIKARVEAATPGPMKVARSDLFPGTPQYLVIRADQELNEHGQVAGGPFQIWDKEADAVFDAHSRTDIPTLLTALDERDVMIRELARLVEQGQRGFHSLVEHPGPAELCKLSCADELDLLADPLVVAVREKA